MCSGCFVFLIRRVNHSFLLLCRLVHYFFLVRICVYAYGSHPPLLSPSFLLAFAPLLYPFIILSYRFVPFRMMYALPSISSSLPLSSLPFIHPSRTDDNPVHVTHQTQRRLPHPTRDLPPGFVQGITERQSDEDVLSGEGR